MKKGNRHGIFLTGGTGLIGSYLLKILLKKGHKIFLLARDNDKQKAEHRVIDNIKFWEPNFKNYKDNLFLLKGDITRKNLGLDGKILNNLQNEIVEIYHCAALTKFNVPLKELRKVNVEGLQNILEVASKWNRKGKFKKINHLSTAYVCGDYSGSFEEDDLDMGQNFYTPYEQSKFEAEKLIHKFRKSGLWIDVFRPPLVIGDSLTGKTISFRQAFYQAIHFLSLGLLEFLPCNNMYFNLVYLEELCNSIYCISLHSRIRNRNYHVFGSELYSAEKFLNFFYKYMRIEKPDFTSHEKFFYDMATPAMKLLLKHNFHFLHRGAKLKSEYTNNFLKKKGFIFSEFEEKKVSKILKYAVQEGFIARGSA